MKSECLWYVRTDGRDWRIARAQALESLTDEQAVQRLEVHCENIGERLICACRTDDRREALRVLFAALLRWRQ